MRRLTQLHESLFFSVTALLAFLVAGCANACIIAVWNPNGTSGAAAGTTCPPQTNKTAQVSAQVTLLCDSCAAPSSPQHIFVTLRSIQLHPWSPGEPSSAWQDLLPSLEEEPLQLDLVSTPSRELVAKPLQEVAAIAVGAYDGVRLRFVMNQTPRDDRFPQVSTCGAYRFNCALLANEAVQPVLPNDELELAISSEGTIGGLLLIPANGGADLVIELTPVWRLGRSLGGSVGLVPVLTGTARGGSRSASTER